MRADEADELIEILPQTSQLLTIRFPFFPKIATNFSSFPTFALRCYRLRHFQGLPSRRLSNDEHARIIQLCKSSLRSLKENVNRPSDTPQDKSPLGVAGLQLKDYRHATETKHLKQFYIIGNLTVAHERSW